MGCSGLSNSVNNCRVLVVIVPIKRVIREHIEDAIPLNHIDHGHEVRFDDSSEVILREKQHIRGYGHLGVGVLLMNDWHSSPDEINVVLW